MKVWVNPRTRPKPVIDEPFSVRALPARNSARVVLELGWNEVLVRVEGRAGTGAVFVEFRAPDNSAPLAGIEFKTDPPAKAP